LLIIKEEDTGYITFGRGIMGDSKCVSVLNLHEDINNRNIIADNGKILFIRFILN